MIDVFPTHEIDDLISEDQATQKGLESSPPRWCAQQGGAQQGQHHRLPQPGRGRATRVPVEVLHRVPVITFI